MGDHRVAIRVKGLSKTFKLPHERHSELRQKILNIGRSRRGYEVQKALDDVSFEVEKGEFFGIVGKNGSGKSTLLKTIAGIYAPDSGKVSVSGKLVPFIELGVGFNPELTGRENVYLNGALLGFSRKEMNAMYDEIVEFAELERFVDQKLKNYSSGMQVRLAFSIAIRAQGDILLLDEVLAVGDSAFQQKCFEYFAQLRNENKTVILVTHNMDSVQRFCTKALMMEDGKILTIGGTDEVTNAYEEANRKSLLKASQQKKKAGMVVSDGQPENVITASVRAMNQAGEAVDVFFPKDKLIFDIDLVAKEEVKNASLSFRIRDSKGVQIYRVVTEHPNPTIAKFEPGRPVNVWLEIQNIFAEDTYTIDVTIKSVDRTREYMGLRGVFPFRVAADTKVGWTLRPEFKLAIDAKEQ